MKGHLNLLEGTRLDFNFKIKVEEGGIISTDHDGQYSLVEIQVLQVNGVIQNGKATFRVEFKNPVPLMANIDLDFEGYLDKDSKLLSGNYKSNFEKFGNNGDFEF